MGLLGGQRPVEMPAGLGVTVNGNAKEPVQPQAPTKRGSQEEEEEEEKRRGVQGKEAEVAFQVLFFSTCDKIKSFFHGMWG
jgi:hypothetical protein